MPDDFRDVLLELDERYPLLMGLAIGSKGAEPQETQIAPFLGVLLSLVQHRERGASCILMPSRDRICLALAVISALHSFKQGFQELELDRLTMPLRPGTLVAVAPENRVFELVKDGVQIHGKRWILLRNPVDDLICYIPADEAFRLTPTDRPQPRPRKGQRPSRWATSPLDMLLGVRTGGNLAVTSNRVILVAARGDTTEAAASTVVTGGAGRATAAELVSWGRVTSDGNLVSDGVHGAPMIAVAHSVEYAAAACAKEGAITKLVIVDGAKRLAANLQAFDDLSLRHRLLVVADHTEQDAVDVLAERGCDAWAPDPEIIMMSRNGDSFSSVWLSDALTAARNCRDFRLDSITVHDPGVEALHEAVAAVPDSADEEYDVGRLTKQAWSILLKVNSWLGTPSASALQAFDRQLAALREGLSGSRMWLPRDMAVALQKVIEAAAALGNIKDVGASKREALIARLREEDTVVVTRTVGEAVRTCEVLQSVGLERPVYPVSRLPVEPLAAVVVCAWPGRWQMSRLANRNRTPHVTVLSYPFEVEWLRPFAGAWRAGWQRYAARGHDIATLTGLKAWPPEALSTSVKQPQPTSALDDPISRMVRRRVQARELTQVPTREAREGYFVGFHGDSYCFLTAGHRVPVLTDMILTGKLSGDRIPLRSVRKLVVGDFILFRDHGDQDVISAIAEQEVGSDRYRKLRQTADIWRPALSSLGESAHEVCQRLRREGLQRSRAAVRAWLTDGDRIAPRSEEDLRIIAKASGNAELSRRFHEVCEAIRTIWSAHISAGFTLTQLLLKELPQRLGQIVDEGVQVEFTFGSGWIVCVDVVADDPELRPYWEVNRLLMDEGG